MRVLALIDTREVNSPCRLLFQLVEQAKGTGVHFVLGMFVNQSCVTIPAVEQARRSGFAVEPLFQSCRYDPGLIEQALKIVKDHNITLLESHGYKSATVACCLKPLTALPWIAFAHGYTRESVRVTFLYNRLDRWLMRWADRVVAVSEAMGRLLRDSGVSEDRIRVVRNAIEPNDYRLDADGSEFRRHIECGPNDLLIGVIGRLSQEKGQTVFVEAFKEVVRIVPRAKAVFVGEGPLLSRLQVAVRSAGLIDHVRFAGFHVDVSPVYAALDLVVIPSLQEGLPYVLLEALLYRKAVVATTAGGIPEVMQAGLSRWLVPVGDARALADVIIQALQNPALRGELGELVAGQVRDLFSPSRRAEQIVGLYKELIEEARPSEARVRSSPTCP